MYEKLKILKVREQAQQAQQRSTKYSNRTLVEFLVINSTRNLSIRVLKMTFFSIRIQVKSPKIKAQIGFGKSKLKRPPNIRLDKPIVKFLKVIIIII